MERIDYFSRHVEVGLCWEWTAMKTEDGYGRFWDGERMVMAYRWLYEYVYATTIPDGYTIDHLCKNPSCVNPDHLEAVTQAENNRRGTCHVRFRIVTAQRMHCKRGHELTADNIYDNGATKRNCKTCQKAVARRQYLKRKERLAQQGMTVRQYQQMQALEREQYLNVTAVA